MSSRFPPSSNSDSRYPRDRSPARSLDSRRPTTQYHDGSLAPSNEGGYRGNDSYGYTGRGHDSAREPPRGPKAQQGPPRGGGYINRGRGAFAGRGDTRDRDIRDIRDEPFGQGGRGRGQDWGPRERFEARDRRPSPVGRDRSRSPLSKDFAGDIRDFAARDDPRRDPRTTPISGPSDAFLFRGRGGFRGRSRGDWGGRDDRRGRAPNADEREPVGTRGRSRDRNWEEPMRDDRDRERNFDSTRRDDDLRKEQEEREDRLKREQQPYRPNSTGGAPTPITSRSTSTASVRRVNQDRYIQNPQDNRDLLSGHRPRAQGSNVDLRMSTIDRDSERGDTRPRSAGNDRYEHPTASPPPQAPPVPAFGSLPQRAATVSQASPTKAEPPRDQSSPLIHPSRLSLLDPSTHAPMAPKAQTFNAPTAPKAQQGPEKWQPREIAERPRSLDDDASSFASQRQSLPGPPEPIRNISRRFSQSRNDYDTTPIRPASISTTGAPDPMQPSVRKAVEEQGRNGNAPSTGASSSMLRPPLGDMSNQRSPVKIPTGPRAERAPTSLRQPASSMRGGATRGPSMMQRPGRGSATWAWVNPALPKHVPRGPSIMNTVPTKRDSIGDDRSRTGPPSAESVEDAVAKWRRANAPSSITTARAPRDRDQNLKSPRSASLTQSKAKGAAEDAVKIEVSGIEHSESGVVAIDEDNDDEESDDGALEDDDGAVGDDDGAAEDHQMDWGEEDFAEAEKKFELDMQALEVRRPPTPRSNPILLDLLESIDALASALEEKAKTGVLEIEHLAQSRPLGLPSPKVDEEDEIDIKQELASPPPARLRPETPPIESLPFLVSGIPTPFSEIEDLQENTLQQTTIEDAIRQQLEEQARTFQAQIDEARYTFVKGFRGWKNNIENIEAARKTKPNEDEMAVSPVPEEMPLAALPAPVLSRRMKNMSELDMQEVIRASQETAAKEDRARREREPVYIPPETFNPDKEAEVPAMLSKDQRMASMFTDTNTLIDPGFALEALEFTTRENEFTSTEHETFLANYLLYPKRFGTIAEALDGRDFRDCVRHYYLTKLSVKYKDQEAVFLKTIKGKRRAASTMRSQMRPRTTGLISSFDGMMDLASQTIALTEKGRPRRAAAPTFGDVVDAEPAATPAATPARRGAAAKDPTSNLSAERPSAKRTKTGTGKEKGGRKAKAQLLAAAPGPSPQKDVAGALRGPSSEPGLDNEQRLSEIEGAQALAGLGSQLYSVPVYQPGPPHGWPTEHEAAMTADSLQKPSQQYGQDQSLPPPPKAGSQATTSSYWSVPEQQDFHNYVRYFGTQWQEIAATMKTKTPVMIRNFYNRKILDGEVGKQLETDALRADKLITSGQDIGPLPAPTPTGEKRRYQYNQQREFHRPLAPSVDSTEVDDSPKLQPTKIQPPARFKQEQARFTTQPTSDQGLEQVSLQLQLQGRKSLENQPTIIPQNHIQQQILGPHLGTFNPEERHRAHFSTRDTVKEKEQREMQIRQQMHEVQQAQQEKEHIQRHQDREGHAHHRNTLSQHQNEQSAQSFQQHAPNLIPNALQSTLVGQQPTSAAQAGAAPAPVVEFRYDDKVEAYLKSQGQQQQQQIIQQQQATQQTRLQQQLQQRQTQIDTSSSMRRFGSSAYGNALSQNHSPASASLPPMSPPGETLRPRSVPVNASIQPPPPGPPKKSSIMDLLNNDAPDPPPRKRLNDQQRPAAPTPPPQQPTYQAGAQQMQPQIQRRDTPTDSVVHMQQQHRPPSFSQPNQHQQQIPPPPPPRERAPNWASAAQHLQQRPYLDERSAQAQVISPQSQPSFLPPNSARNSIQALQQQRSHVSTPPPFGQHSRNPSYASVQQIQQHQQLQHQHQHHHHYQQQQSLPSTPAEPNIRPSPYASLNPSQPPQQQQQPQTPLQQRLEMQQREAILMQQQEHAQQQQQHQQYRMQQQQEQEHARRQGRLTFEQEIIQQDLQREFEMRQQQQAIRDHELAGRREMEERERERGRFPATFFGGDLQRR